MNAKIICFLLFVVAIAGCKDEGSNNDNPDPQNNNQNTGPHTLSFDFGTGSSWFATQVTGSKDGNTLILKGESNKGEKLEIKAVNLLGDHKVPIGGSNSYLVYTSADGEEFDTRIGGGGNLFYSTNTQEKVEGTFLFPQVQSIKNNFIEINNGQFSFELPLNVKMALPFNFIPEEGYLFIDRPKMKGELIVDYVSGPKSGYNLEVSASNGMQVEHSFSGTVGSNIPFVLNGSQLTSKQKVEVSFALKRADAVVKEFTVSFDALPVFGTYRLQSMGEAPQNSATISIIPILSPEKHFYKVEGNLFNETILFEADEEDRVECYATPQYLGETTTSIYIYDENAFYNYIAIHTKNHHHFYRLIRI